MSLRRFSGYRLPRRRFLSLAAGATAAAFAGRLPGLRVTPSFAGASRLETENPEPQAVVRDVLPNGLMIIVEERRTAETVAFQLTARAGARDDADQPGLTVITSRMIFQGTSRRPSETDLQRAATQVGGTLTRGTTVETSWFSSVVPSRETDVAFDLLADLALDPLFDPDALTRQRELALQELAQRRANPRLLIDDLFQATIFAGHPASTPLLGTSESIETITRDGLVQARARLWNAANLVLTIVGRIRPEEALAGAGRYFASVPSGSANERPMVPVELPESPRRVQGQAGQQQIDFRLGFPTPGLLHPDRYPLTVLNALMTGSSGRLFRELRGALGLAYVAGSSYTTYTDAGAWFATAGVDPQNLDRALDVVLAEIEGARSGIPDPDQVARRLTQIAGRQILADETNSARASRLASQQVLGTESTEEFVRRIREVTPADVLRVAREYLEPDHSVLVAVGPRGSLPWEEE